MNRRQEYKRRALGIATLLLIGAAAQVYANTADSGALWPFNPVAVYRRFPNDHRFTSSEAFVVTPAGERHVVKAGLTGQRAVRRFRAAVFRAVTAAERRKAAESFFRYLAREAPTDAEPTGVKLYQIEWDLAAGRVIRRSVLANPTAGQYADLRAA